MKELIESEQQAAGIDRAATLAAAREIMGMQKYCALLTVDAAVPYMTVWLTSEMLPNCTLETKENGKQFSSEALDEYIETVIAERYKS